MLCSLLLMLAGGVALSSLADSSSDEGQEFSNDGEDDVTLTGTEGDDIFTVSSETATVSDLTIEAGGGDDTLDLTGENYMGTASFWLYDSEVYAGDGDDVITLDAAYGSLIDGGDGDDTIDAGSALWSTIRGGAGDDYITTSSINGDPITIEGEDGDDTIDATLVGNGRIDGGAGNDTILTSAYGTSGDAYSISATGGEGDDTLTYTMPDYGTFWDEHRISLSGGEGADLFELNIHEAVDQVASNLPERVVVMTLPDFEPGVDMIEVEALVDNEEYDFTTASIETVAGSDLTSLVLTYEHDTEPDRNMVIEIHSGDVTWDDITFVGENLSDDLYYADTIYEEAPASTVA